MQSEMVAFSCFYTYLSLGMRRLIRLTESDLSRVVRYAVNTILNEASSIGNKPTEDEYYRAMSMIDNASNTDEYDYYQSIIDRYEHDDDLYWELEKLSNVQRSRGQRTDSEYLMTNGKIIRLNSHASANEIGLSKEDMLQNGNIRIIGGYNSDSIMMELSVKPTEAQLRYLWKIIPTCKGTIYADVNGKSYTFDRSKVGADFIIDRILSLLDN